MILVDPVASKTADVSVSINTERQSIPTSPLEHAIYRHRERMHFSPIYCGEYINVGPANKLIDLIQSFQYHRRAFLPPVQQIELRLSALNSHQ